MLLLLRGHHRLFPLVLALLKLRSHLDVLAILLLLEHLHLLVLADGDGSVVLGL